MYGWSMRWQLACVLLVLTHEGAAVRQFANKEALVANSAARSNRPRAVDPVIVTPTEPPLTRAVDPVIVIPTDPPLTHAVDPVTIPPTDPPLTHAVDPVTVPPTDPPLTHAVDPVTVQPTDPPRFQSKMMMVGAMMTPVPLPFSTMIMPTSPPTLQGSSNRQLEVFANGPPEQLHAEHHTGYTPVEERDGRFGIGYTPFQERDDRFDMFYRQPNDGHSGISFAELTDIAPLPPPRPRTEPSFAELSDRKKAVSEETALGLWFLALAVCVIAGAFLIRSCYTPKYGWSVPACCSRRPQFEDFQLLVCVHSLEMAELDSNGYMVWLLTRNPGEGGKPPLRGSLTDKSAGSMREAMQATQFPANLSVHVTASRPDLQLAIYRPQEGKEPEYVGCVRLDVSKSMLDTGKLHDLPFVVQTEDMPTRYSLTASFYTQGENTALIEEWSKTSFGPLPLSSRCLLDFAISAARVRMRELQKFEEPTCMDALASALTGNFLYTNSTGNSELKYFEMVQKKSPSSGSFMWMWVWFQRPKFVDFQGYEGENLMEGYIALRSISEVVGIPDSDALCVYYDREIATVNGAAAKVVLHRSNHSADFFDCVRGRDEIVCALRAMTEANAKITRNFTHTGAEDKEALSSFPPARKLSG